MVRRSLILLLLTLLASVAAASANPAEPGAMIPRAFLPLVLVPAANPALTPTAFEQRVVDLVNQERARVGCAALTVNAQLMTAARLHSEDMAMNNRFSHTGSDGSTVQQRIDAAGYAWSRYGENIAAGLSTPDAVMFDSAYGWMSSPGHRANILNCSMREIGVGYYYQADDQPNVRLDNGVQSGPFFHYWTQVFGSPR